MLDVVSFNILHILEICQHDAGATLTVSQGLELIALFQTIVKIPEVNIFDML